MSESERHEEPLGLAREVAEAERALAAEATDARELARAVAPPFQPLRTATALVLTAAGFGAYELVLTSFWSSPLMGIHQRIPYPAYAGLAIALILALGGVRAALGVRSPHLKLGLFVLAFLTCVVVGVGGGRFVSYTLRGTRNPDFALAIARGDRFPEYALADQYGAIHRGPRATAGGAMLIFVYRGDFCPFARYELGQLTEHRDELRRAGLEVVAISADPIARSQMLARFLNTDIPLLSDEQQAVLGPLGLVERHPAGRPDGAIPAFFIVDNHGVVRWTFTSPYYREMPSREKLLDAAAAVKAGAPSSPRAP